MINKNFENLFDNKRRQPEKDNITQFHMDIASSIQSVIEEIILKMSVHFKNKYKIDNLCLAGGVCLNCVANGKLLIKIFSKRSGYNPLLEMLVVLWRCVSFLVYAS